MTFFRLVLCVAGLAIYLLARHAVNSPLPAHASHVGVPLKPEVGTNTVPHAELLATSSELAARKQK